jgi:hypothetical protein
MSQAQELPCPHCKKDITKPPIVQTPEPHNHSHDVDPHEELAKIMPRSVNFSKCPNGDCSKGLIKNAKGITTKFKKCPNCQNNAVPKAGDYCPTCGVTQEDLDKSDAEWDDSDLEIPTKKDDED